jgi:hypothetical protein
MATRAMMKTKSNTVNDSSSFIESNLIGKTFGCYELTKNPSHHNNFSPSVVQVETGWEKAGTKAARSSMA